MIEPGYTYIVLEMHAAALFVHIANVFIQPNPVPEGVDDRLGGDAFPTTLGSIVESR